MTLKNKISLLILTATFIACGPRSGVTTESKEIATCDVTEQAYPDTNKSVATVTGENGRRLFKYHCAVCHAPMDINPESGKNLRGIMDRMPKPADTYIKNYIQDSYAVREGGDGYAKMIKARSKVDYEHKFKDVITEKEAQDIVEYIGLIDKPIN